ncbi:MAG: TetR/AcrR family transcriptional regulator [Thermodesulfobacteriota bacterium]|nr:TetR/AcrR family transcriptional regulator [Thermodesulfobacteriota bacterium]
MTRKEAILKTATRLFAKKGFFSTPTSEVAKVAGVAEGTLFHHFKSKEGILMKIFEDIMDIYIKGIEQRIKRSDSGLDAIEKILIFHFNFIEKRSNEALIILRDLPSQFMDKNSPFKDSVKDYILRVLKLLKACIERGEKDGSIKIISSERGALILYGMINGLSRQKLLAPFLKSPNLRKEVIDFCRYGLGG